MDSFVPKQLLRTRTQFVRVTIVLLQPVLEHLVNRRALPPGSVIRINRVERVETED
jgi:hypothetical protein